MDKVKFERVKELIIEVMNLHQAAVSDFGYKEVFSVVKKNDTYGFNEMNAAILLDRLEYLSEPSARPPKQPAKLGLMDFIIEMAVTGNLAPLKAINSFFNMGCFEIPDGNVDKNCLLTLLQEINKEHFENGNEVMERIKDGVFCKKDAKAVLKESGDLINATAKLRFLAQTKVEEG